MLILKESESKFIVSLEAYSTGLLQGLAEYFTKCDTAKMLEIAIKDGMELSVSIRKLHEDKAYERACMKRLCTTHPKNNNDKVEG